MNLRNHEWNLSDVLSEEITTNVEFIRKWNEKYELLTPPSSQTDNPPPAKKQKCNTHHLKDATDEAIEHHKIGKLNSVLYSRHNHTQVYRVYRSQRNCATVAVN